MAASKILGNKNTLLKVIILGDGGVGKSCLMNRFVNNQFDDHSFHTIGVEFLNKEMRIKNESFTLQVLLYTRTLLFFFLFFRLNLFSINFIVYHFSDMGHRWTRKI